MNAGLEMRGYYVDPRARYVNGRRVLNCYAANKLMEASKRKQIRRYLEPGIPLTYAWLQEVMKGAKKSLVKEVWRCLQVLNVENTMELRHKRPEDLVVLGISPALAWHVMRKAGYTEFARMLPELQ